jgi:hypothetical protein
MSDKLSANSGKRQRLSEADLTQEQRAAIEARRGELETERYQEDLARDIEAYQQEFPPAADHELALGRRLAWTLQEVGKVPDSPGHVHG